jgi:signal transduction histidine kinase
MDLTGYSSSEFIQMYIKEAFYSLLLSGLDPVIFERLDMQEKQVCYLFTESCEARAVIVEKFDGEKGDEFYVFSEVRNSRFHERYPFLRSLMQLNRTGIALFCPSKLILLDANSRYYSFLDAFYTDPCNSIGRTIYDIFPGWEGSALDELMQKVLSGKNSLASREARLKGFQRGIVYWDVTFIPLMDNEKMMCLVCIIDDVTERVNVKKLVNNVAKSIQRQKSVHEEELRMRNEFFQYITHEFKTPLTVINAAVQAVENLCGNETSNKTKKYMHQIKQNSLRQLRLVNNLLDVTKVESQYLKICKKTIDIVLFTGSITESVSLYAKAKNVELLYTPGEESRIIRIDDAKYERIILNLLSNAIKYTPEGKCIRIILECSNKMLIVQVADEGIGISPENCMSVFERFRQVENKLTRDSGGTGLGLYLVKLLVEAMGGSIDVESELGVGSTFKVSLPYESVGDCVREDTVHKTDEKRLIKAAEIEFSHLYDFPDEKDEK